MRSPLRAAAGAAFLGAFALSSAHAQPSPDGHAPIGVMADHTHAGGEAMLSVRTMYMGMAGSRLGTDGIADADIVAPDGQNFLVTPSEMPMTMTMLGAMVAPTDRITIMAMVPYVSMSMDHRSRQSVAADPGAVAFSTESAGIGDVSATALVKLARIAGGQVHAGLGASVPTGSVDQRDDTPMGEDQLLPYPMQTGSGTVDLRPSLTAFTKGDRLSGGGQVRGTVRLGTNRRDFAYGDAVGLTAWGAARVTDFASVSLRLDGQAWGNVTDEGSNYAMGVDSRLVPTVFPELRAGERVELSAGVNTVVTGGPLAGLRLAAEAGLPVYQRLAGPQLETDVTVTVGAQYAFSLF